MRDDITHAIDQLQRSARGSKALTDLLQMLEHGADLLDFNNQRALALLLQAAFSTPGLRNQIREHLEDGPPREPRIV